MSLLRDTYLQMQVLVIAVRTTVTYWIITRVTKMQARRMNFLRRIAKMIAMKVTLMARVTTKAAETKAMLTKMLTISIYKFNNFFKNLKTPLKKHYYCSACYTKLKDASPICLRCNVKDNVTYLIEIPIIAQLRTLFKRSPFYKNISTHRFNREKSDISNIEDIYDGSVYKHLESSGFLSSKNNISFTWNTDGVPIFKSSKFSIWPFYLVINELPYELRMKKENVILAGLWFGIKKPQPNLFLSTFTDSLKKLYKGVHFLTHLKTKIKVRAILICGTCDLQAKCLFLNMKSCAGYFGCLKCKIRGLRIGHFQTFPYQEELGSAQHLKRLNLLSLQKRVKVTFLVLKGAVYYRKLLITISKRLL